MVFVFRDPVFGRRFPGDVVCAFGFVRFSANLCYFCVFFERDVLARLDSVLCRRSCAVPGTVELEDQLVGVEANVTIYMVVHHGTCS